MLIVLSPAKALNFTTPEKPAPMTTPMMAADIAELAVTAKALTVRQLKSLMDLSDNLATLNRERFQAFDPAMEDGLQAAFAFNGDVYSGLKARELDKKGLAYAQDHIRILSGLYGLLRPLDLIQAYRLEMRIPLENARGRDLYAFWGDRLTRAVNQLLAAGPGAPVLVNLASGEYFQALDGRALAGRVITPVFQELKPGGYKVISFHAKRARGLMARYAIRKRAEDPELLKRFREEGYAFDRKASEADRWFFRRG